MLSAEFALLAGLGHQSADFCFGVTYDVDISTNTFNKKAFAPSDAKRYKDMTTKFNVKKRPLYCYPGVLFLRCNDASIRERLTKQQQQQQQTNNKQTKHEALNVSSYGVQHLCRTKTCPILIFSKGGNETGVLVLSDDRLTFFSFFFALIVLFLLVPVMVGRAIWTKHVRNGKELPEIGRDNNYDFNFQV